MMKKNFLFVMLMTVSILFTLSSCKSKTEPANTPTVEQSAPMPESSLPTALDIANNIAIPSFSNADVSQFCQEFKTLMIDYATNKGTSDTTKAAELEKQFTAWAGKAAGLVGKIKPEELNSFNDFITSAQEKFKELASAPSQPQQ